MSWNYRIGTKIFSYKKGFEKIDKRLANKPDIRLFSILEVYYDKAGRPNAYHSNVSFNNFENISDIQFIVDKVQEALTKPILDMDNWPNEYIA